MPCVCPVAEDGYSHYSLAVHGCRIAFLYWPLLESARPVKFLWKLEQVRKCLPLSSALFPPSPCWLLLLLSNTGLWWWMAPLCSQPRVSNCHTLRGWCLLWPCPHPWQWPHSSSTARTLNHDWSLLGRWVSLPEACSSHTGKWKWRESQKR